MFDRTIIHRSNFHSLTRALLPVLRRFTFVRGIAATKGRNRHQKSRPRIMKIDGPVGRVMAIEYFHGEIHRARQVRVRYLALSLSLSFERQRCPLLAFKGSQGTKETEAREEEKADREISGDAGQRFVTSAAGAGGGGLPAGANRVNVNFTLSCTQEVVHTFTSGGSTRRRANDLLTHRTASPRSCYLRWWSGKAVHRGLFNEQLYLPLLRVPSPFDVSEAGFEGRETNVSFAPDPKQRLINVSRLRPSLATFRKPASERI